MKICFLDQTNFSYSIEDRYSSQLRGAENILINYSLELSKLGNYVTVYNNCKTNYTKFKNLNWFNLESINKKNKPSFDIAIANGDCRLLDRIVATKKFVISYSLQSIEKFIRKGQLISYIKNKPIYLLLGKYHSENRSKILSLYGKKIIKIAIDDIFINSLQSNNPDNNLAIFTSRPDRNMNILIDIWKNYIHPKNKNAKLLLTPRIEPLPENYNMSFRKMLNKNQLINTVSKSRLILLPGHKAELFCLAAEEAKELCIPIITLGIGSLKERVEHGKTGFIAKNKFEFAEYTNNLFKDDILYNDIKKNLYNLKGSKTWNTVTKDFMNILNNS